MADTKATKGSAEAIDAKKVAEEQAFKDEMTAMAAKCPQILQLNSLEFKDSEIAGHQLKPMIRCSHSIKIEDLIRHVIHSRWKLKDPRIVVFIISNIGSINEWNNTKQIECFQKGLMKAAENTNMWLIGHGVDIGSTAIVGDAVKNYVTEAKYKRSIDYDKSFKTFNFIGIADEESLKYSQSIINNKDQPIISLGSEGVRQQQEKYELNPYFTHYLLLNDDKFDNTGCKTGINEFLKRFITFLSINQKFVKTSTIDDDEMLPIEVNEVPVVAIVMKGGYSSAQIVLQHIRTDLPVVVLKGTGGLADLLAFVDTEIRDQCMDSWNVEFVDVYLKPELTKKLMEVFPKLRDNLILCETFRSQILDIIRESRKNGHNFLTVIDMSNIYSCNLEALTEHLLQALFRSKRDQRSYPTADTSDGELVTQQRKRKVQLRKDLILCVDWNCPEVAKNEVLNKDEFGLNSEKKLFEESLLRSNCLDFIELFLTQKFKLRAFISPKRVKRLYRKIHGRDFFRSVCWESMLGRSADQKQSNERFLNRDLNWLVEACTGITGFINQEELDLYVTQQFPYSDRVAERKALFIIILWAVMDFRKDLVRLLWRHCEQPIHMAITIAVCYERLSWYVTEQTIAAELKTESVQFVKFASQVLDICYKDSFARTEHVLEESPKDYNYKTVVDLAAFGRFRNFFTHPSCQRWLTNKFYGNISVREFRSSVFRLPTLMKLLLSAYLLFPMYLWIRVNRVNTGGEDSIKDDDDEDLEEEVAAAAKRKPSDGQVPTKPPVTAAPLPPKPNPKETKDKPLSDHTASDGSRSSSDSESNKTAKKPTHLAEKPIEKKPKIKTSEETDKEYLLGKRYKRLDSDIKMAVTGQVPPWVLIYETWNAPITKFWNYQFFYTFYLSVFSMAVLYPRCGNFWLDLTVCLWTVLIIADDIRQAYLLNKMGYTVSMTHRSIEILWKSFWCGIYATNRVMTGADDWILFNPYHEKVVLCLALLHAYYVLLYMFLPISITLGPLLYRLKIMILVDFLNWIRLSILVIISFGVVIQAILYPDLAINSELFRQLFHRAIFAMFSTPNDELTAKPGCSTSYLTPNDTKTNICYASIYSNETCNVTGIWPYIFELMYFILLKLVFITLLYAIFSNSSERLTSDTNTIWKFQRYGLVMEFAIRVPLPPPLNIFYFMYWFCKWICKLSYVFYQPYNKDKPFKFSDLLLTTGETRGQSKPLTDDDYNYFKLLAGQVYDEHNHKCDGEKRTQDIWEMIKSLCQGMETQRQETRLFRAKLSKIEHILRQN